VQACAEVINHVGVRTKRRWITQTIKAEASHEGSFVLGRSPGSGTGLLQAMHHRIFYTKTNNVK